MPIQRFIATKTESAPFAAYRGGFARNAAWRVAVKFLRSITTTRRAQSVDFSATHATAPSASYGRILPYFGQPSATWAVSGFYFAPFDSHGGLVNWLWGSGIGTNIGASIIWSVLVGCIGYFVAKRIRSAWRRMHAKLTRHQQLTEEIHHLLYAGKPHPRVQARVAAGEHPTPKGS